MLGNDISLVIVGNKIDLEKDRHVSAEEAERYDCRSLHCPMCHVDVCMFKVIHMWRILLFLLVVYEITVMPRLSAQSISIVQQS